MLFLAKFQGDLLPVLVDMAPAEGEELAAIITRTIERVEAETGERPVTIHPLVPGVLFCEVKFSTVELDGFEAESVAQLEGNSANLAELGVTLEPFELFAEWLEAVDEQAPPAVLALAPTEPPAVEQGEQPDGG